MIRPLALALLAAAGEGAGTASTIPPIPWEAGTASTSASSILGPASTSTSTSTIPGTPDPACACAPNVTDHFLEHAQIMKMEMLNKTSLFSRIRHRTTRSHEAVWAALSLSGLLTLLLVAVLHSQLWLHRPHVTTMDSQPIKFIQWNRLAEVRVKELVRSRGRALLNLFPGRRAARPGGLRMEAFLGQDAVDGEHRALLVSSSSEGEWDGADSEDEDVVFSINRRTGEWEGRGEEGRGLLGERRARRRRLSSSGSSTGSLVGLHSSLARLSSREESDEEMMVKIG